MRIKFLEVLFYNFDFIFNGCTLGFASTTSSVVTIQKPNKNKRKEAFNILVKKQFREMSRLTFAILFVLVAVACSFTFSPRG